MLVESRSIDGQHVLQFDEDKHKYWLDGELVPGATAVNSSYPKAEGLIQWMIKQGIEEHKSKTKLRRASDIGTVVHDFAYKLEKGLPFDFAPVEASPHRDAMMKAIGEVQAWKAKNQDEVLMAEVIVASVTMRGAGKFDSLRKRADKVVLSDWKTAKSIYVTNFIQLGGYRRMLREWLGVTVDLLEIVKFPKEEKGFLEIATADADGMTINGERYQIPGLLTHLEQQYERNVGTWRFQGVVEKTLSDHYEAKWKRSLKQ